MILPATTRRTSSGKEKIVAEKADPAKDEACRSVILNFSAYYNRWKTNRDRKIVALKEQFGNTGVVYTENGDEESFFRGHLYGEKEPGTAQTLYFSHPSFVKPQLQGDDCHLENVVIRVQSARMKDYDLVLQGNFEKPEKVKKGSRFERADESDEKQDTGDKEEKAKSSPYEYFVTRFSMVSHVGRYIGEIESRCRLYCRISSRDGTKITVGPGNNDTRGVVSYRDNVIDPTLVSELCSKYPVLRPKETEDVLTDWEGFLNMKEKIIGLNTENCFYVGRPQVFHAYYGPAKSASDKGAIILDQGKGQVWTEEIIPTFEQYVLVKLVHELPGYMDHEEQKAYEERLRKLTADSVMLADPTVEEEEVHEDQEVRLRNLELSRLGTRVSIDSTTALSEEETSGPRERRDAALEAIEEGYRGLMEPFVEAGIEGFSDSEEVRLAADEYVRASSESIRADADRLREDRADEELERLTQRYNEMAAELGPELAGSVEKDLHDVPEGKRRLYQEYSNLRGGLDLDTVMESITITSCIMDVSKEYRDRKVKELTDIKRKSLERDFMKQHREERQAKVKEVEQAYRGELAEISKSTSKGCVTMFFKIEVDKTRSVVEEVAERVKFFSLRSQYAIIHDNEGERSLIDRQREAIRSLKEGTFSNPFLATFIYNPELLPVPESRKISHYFGTSFNEQQKRAIEGAVFANGLYLIQGPPGTGKTQVIAEITAQEAVRGRKVLITSQGNKAIDNAFKRLTDYGFLRPIRIMAETKESEYELKNIVHTFYRNTARAFEMRVDLLRDGDKREEVLAKIAEFKSLYAEYEKISSEASTFIKQYEKLLKDSKDNNETLNCMNADIEVLQNHHDELEKLMTRLPDFEYSDYESYANAIRNLFFYKADTPEKDKALFGKDKICSTLVTMDLGVLEKEVADMCASGGAPAPGSQLSKVFKESVPVDLLEVRRNLEVFLEASMGSAKSQLDVIGSELGKSLSESVSLRQNYKAKIEEMESREDLARYFESEKNLRRVVSDIFSYLKLADTYDNLRDAMEILQAEERNLGLFSTEVLDDHLPDCEKVVEYLTRENVDGYDRDMLVKELTEQVNVIGMTCTAKEYVRNAEGRKDDGPQIDLKKINVDTVIVDEVSKIPFPELIRPLALGKKVILVGDHKQLPPVYNENVEEDDMKSLNAKYEKMYTEALFDTLFEKCPEYSKTMLTRQYRMSSQIMDAVNRFYDGKLEMGVSDEDRRHYLRVDGMTRPLIDEGHSVLFVNCKGKERKEAGSTSYYNGLEARVVAKLLISIDVACERNTLGHPINTDKEENMSIGVITPYADQMRHLKNLLHLGKDMACSEVIPLKGFITDGEERFSIKSVDDFQGDERDIILLSLVRTRESRFISDFRRINVAMSRARRLLVIVGNAETLEQQVVRLDGKDTFAYKDIIEGLKEKGCYVEAEEILGVEQ